MVLAGYANVLAAIRLASSAAAQTTQYNTMLVTLKAEGATGELPGGDDLVKTVFLAAGE